MINVPIPNMNADFETSLHITKSAVKNYQTSQNESLKMERYSEVASKKMKKEIKSIHE